MTSLTIPSDRWFSLVEAATREAQRHGLQVWLADEYPYPSGAIGGEQTLRHPEYRAWQMHAKSLIAETDQSVECFAPGSVLLSATAVPIVNGVTDWTRAIDLRDQVGISQPEPVFVEPAFGYSGKRSFSFGPRPKLSWSAPTSSAWEIWLIAAAELAPYKFYGHYVDLCNPEAVRAFLATTYQRYAERLDPSIFRQISGFFLDEAHPQSWSWELPTAFEKQTGYDLIPLLPALWTNIGPKTAQVRYDYWQTITTQFMESFHRPIADWCQRHDLLPSLEVDSPRNLVQRYADIGGNDPGHEKVGVPLEEIRTPPRPRYRVNPRFAASLAAQVGRNRVLDECFHSVGWSLTLQDMKAMVDRLAAEGANLFVFHAFFYTLDGLRKWDGPPSQFCQNPYWSHFRRFTDYVGRLSYALSSGQRVAPVALVDPITSLCTHGAVGTGVAGPGPGPDALGTKLSADWQYLMGELEAAQRLFDTLDPLLLTEGTVDQGTLRIGHAAYRVIVLPPLTSLEGAAWAKLEEFATSGGHVVACGLLPDEQIEPTSEVAARCAAHFDSDPARLRQAYERLAEESTPTDRERVSVGRNGSYTLLHTEGTLVQTNAAPVLLDLLDSLSPPDLTLLNVDTLVRRSLLIAQRQQADETIFFVANASADETDCEVALRTVGSLIDNDTRLVVERIDLEDGTKHRLYGSRVIGPDGIARVVVPLHFSRYGSQLVSLHRGPNEAEDDRLAAISEHITTTVNVPLNDVWHCSLAGDNALRFDRFHFGVATEDSVAVDVPPKDWRSWPIVEPKPLINALNDLNRGRQGWPVPLRVETPFGTPAQISLHLPVTAWYTSEFDVETIPEHAALCAEMSAFQGDWAVWLNDQPVPTSQFRRRVRWDLSNHEADVRPLLRRGRNTLAIRMTMRQQTDGLVDAVYLLGNFGVTFKQPGLPFVGDVPRQVDGTRLHLDGLPFYAGVVHLTQRIDLPAEGGPFVLSLPDHELMYLGVAELALNGRRLGVRPWAPFRWTVPAEFRRPDNNEITVSLTTTLVGLLEGKRYDPVRRALMWIGLE